MSEADDKYSLIITETGIQGDMYDDAKVTITKHNCLTNAEMALQEKFGEIIAEHRSWYAYVEFDRSKGQARIFGETEVIVMAIKKL